MRFVSLYINTIDFQGRLLPMPAWRRNSYIFLLPATQNRNNMNEQRNFREVKKIDCQFLMEIHVHQHQNYQNYSLRVQPKRLDIFTFVIGSSCSPNIFLNYLNLQGSLLNP